jgi:hypothetical protein
VSAAAALSATDPNSKENHMMWIVLTPNGAGHGLRGIGPFHNYDATKEWTGVPMLVVAPGDELPEFDDEDEDTEATDA